MRHDLLSLFGLMLLVPLGSPTLATTNSEDQGSQVLQGEGKSFHEEIQVTARKREENIRDVPLAVTVFTDEALEERSMLDLSDIADFTPNMDFSSFGDFGDQGAEAAVTIRGIGQLDTALFADPGVGIYVDGVFYSRAQGGVLDLLDLERVEVLRGPQGTLFGKNTTGGAISLITKKPRGQFGAQLRTTAGALGRRELQGQVTGPLTKDLAASLAFSTAERDGYSRSLASDQDFHDVDRQNARLAFFFTPTPSLSVHLSGDSSRARETGGNQILLSLFNTPLLDFYNRSLTAAGLPAYDTRWVTGDLFRNHATLPSFHDGNTWGSTLDLSWTRRNLLLHTISAWRSFDFANVGEHDASPLPVSERSRRQTHDQFSQEVQLSGNALDGRLTWLAGALYFRERPREEQDLNIMDNLFDALEAAPGPVISPPGVPSTLCTGGAPPPGVPCFGGFGNPLNLAFFNGFGSSSLSDLETRSLSFFTHGTFALSPRFSASAGLRYSRDEKTFHYLNFNNFGILDSDLDNEGDWDAWTPHVSLTYQARPESMLYFSAARGYKSGGFNGRPQQRQVLDPYDPETVWTYETGLKTSRSDRRLHFNGSLFLSDYEDIQFFAVLDVNAQPVFVLKNAGTAQIWGVEAELSARPTQNLLIEVGVGHLDTELRDLDPGVPAGLREGGSLPKAPEWTATTALQYSFSLPHGALTLRGDYSYRSRVENDVANTPGIVQEGYGLFNARILYTPPSDRWELSFFGANLSNEAYLERGVFGGAFGVHLGVAGRPREWGISAQVRF